MRFTRLSLWLATVGLIVTQTAAAAVPQLFDTPYVTRAEALMLLLQSRIAQIPDLKSNGEFPDVKKGAWYERYVVVAERLGIISKHPVTKHVRPDHPIARAEFLAMAAKTYGINTAAFTHEYLDVPREAWFAPFAGMAQQLQLFPADPNQKTLRPEQFMIHTEVVRAVQTLNEIVAREEGTQEGSGASEQAAFNLKLYQKISTTTKQIPVIKARGAVPHLAGTGRRTGILLVHVPAAGSSPTQIPALRAEVLRLVNAERIRKGLRPVRENSSLVESAQRYANQMAEKNFFGHVSPTGETLHTRMEESGYYRPFFQSDCLCVRQYMLGENLARGQKTPEETIRAWLFSPSHRDAILNPTFRDAGVGVKAGIWVMHFGGIQE